MRLKAADHADLIAKLEEIKRNIPNATLTHEDASTDEFLPRIEHMLQFSLDNTIYTVSVTLKLKGGCYNSKRLTASVYTRNTYTDRTNRDRGVFVWGALNYAMTERKTTLCRHHEKGMIDDDGCVWDGEFIRYFRKARTLANGKTFQEVAPVRKDHNTDAVVAKGEWVLVDGSPMVDAAGMDEDLDKAGLVKRIEFLNTSRKLRQFLYEPESNINKASAAELLEYLTELRHNCSMPEMRLLTWDWKAEEPDDVHALPFVTEVETMSDEHAVVISDHAVSEAEAQAFYEDEIGM